MRYLVETIVYIDIFENIKEGKERKSDREERKRKREKTVKKVKIQPTIYDQLNDFPFLN